MLAALNIGALIALALAPNDTTGFVVPWRYWGVAAGIIIEVSGIYARIVLWGDVLNYRDVIFLAINVCVGVAAFGLVLTTHESKEEVHG